MIDRYLVLGLRLGKHVDGFVDAYYGPSELAQQVEGEPVTDPRALAEEAAALLELADGLDGQRRVWLRAQLVGLETVALRLAGDEISWVDEVERCHGVRPDFAPEQEFADAHRLLDDAFGGDDGYRDWLETYVTPPDLVLPAAELLRQEARSRTRERFGLPEGEGATLELVTNEPWLAFNYYLGELRSRVVINADLPMWSHRLAGLVAHELYPGHHTEHASKEQGLVRDRGALEESILLTGTPQSLVAEGIAELAPEMAFGESLHQEAADLLRPLGVPYDPETAAALQKAEEVLTKVGNNMAYLLHVEGRPRDEVLEYGVHWRRLPQERMEKLIDFLTDPAWRAYAICYTAGLELGRGFVGGDPERFRRLLTEQLTPADLTG